MEVVICSPGLEKWSAFLPDDAQRLHDDEAVNGVGMDALVRAWAADGADYEACFRNRRPAPNALRHAFAPRHAFTYNRGKVNEV